MNLTEWVWLVLLGIAQVMQWRTHRHLVEAHDKLTQAYIARTPPPEYIRDYPKYIAWTTAQNRGKWKG